MVFQDYDEDEGRSFDDEAGHPVPVVSNMHGKKKARVSGLFLQRKCCGVNIVTVLLLAILGIVSIGLIIKNAGAVTSSGDDWVPRTPAPPASDSTPTPAPKNKDKHKKKGNPGDPTGLPPLENDDTEWKQIGQDVGAIQNAPGNFGISVGISGNGKVFAEGAHKAVGKDAESGHVRIYRYDEQNDRWRQWGMELLGVKQYDEYGYAIDLSRSGNHIAVGAPGAHRHIGPDYGMFNVHSWNETSQEWVRMGKDKWGIQEGDRAASDITISENGDVLIIGAPGCDNKGRVDAGEVRVFFYMAHTDRWLRHGQDLTGEAAGDRFGTSVAVSDDGNVMAAGAPLSNDAIGGGGNMEQEGAGQIRVFQYHREEFRRFHKLGHTLWGHVAGGHFGAAVACSADCLIVAGGAPMAEIEGISNVGYVEVNRYYPDTEKWHRMGSVITGTHAFDNFGSSLDLSEDGMTLVVGSPTKQDSKGAIRVFRFDQDKEDWYQAGEEILGDGPYDFWGAAVALSADGHTIVSGGNNHNGKEPGIGHVRAYRAEF